MTWKYGVVKHEYENEDEFFYEVYEIYYNDKGEIVARSENPEGFPLTESDLEMILKEIKEGEFIDLEQIDKTLANQI